MKYQSDIPGFSDEYVNMCRLSDHIQELWDPAVGDFVIMNNLRSPRDVHGRDVHRIVEINEHYPDYIRIGSIPNRTYSMKEHQFFWVPRIDYVVGMLLEHRSLNFNNFIDDLTSTYPPCDTDILSVYVQTAFDEEWDGLGWNPRPHRHRRRHGGSSTN